MMNLWKLNIRHSRHWVPSIKPQFLKKHSPLLLSRRHQECCLKPKPYHLICFKEWTPEMVLGIIESAINLKCICGDTHGLKFDTLAGCKVMILQEINEPILNMAVSKAATLLGAYDVNIVDHLVWEHDYNGRVFSMMSDAIFVSTMTHMCMQRFADQSTVPVLCMRSRTHASIQSLATVMAIVEEFGTMHDLNIAYLGPAHPVLNSYLLLCPLLKANIKFKCCCNKIKVSPLLYKTSEAMCEQAHTAMKSCDSKEELLDKAAVVIAGPTSDKKETKKDFKLTEEELVKKSDSSWIFFHTCPRGDEISDDLFNHDRSRTFTAFQNMQFIAAALMARAVKGITF